MVTFGLVHGSQHGGWCWERLTPIDADLSTMVGGHSPFLARPAELADLLDALVR